MPAAPHPAAPTTPRADLARVAAAAATAVDGVLGLRAGEPPLFVTDVGTSRLAGVQVVASEPGRYEVTLSVAARMVPLHALGSRIRDVVRERVRVAGLADQLGDVTVHVDDVVASIVPPGLIGVPA